MSGAQTDFDTDDELPPWLGMHMRDVTDDIHRAAEDLALDQKETK